MIIRKLNLISFGKFKNKTIELRSGLNVIAGDNEAGKSTLAGFIYVMLYGFGTSRGKGISLRERFTPWDGSCAEGSMEIESEDGSCCTIYRKCGKTKKSDVLKIFDGTSGTQCTELPEELKQIGADTYEKTLFIRQASTHFDGTTEEITAKLSNLSDSGSENVSFEKAQKILDTMRRRIQLSRGNGGELAVINQRLFNLAGEKDSSERKLAERNRLQKRLLDAQAELDAAKRIYNDFCAEESSDELRIAAELDERGLQLEKLLDKKNRLLSDYRKELLTYNKLKKFENVPRRCFTIGGAAASLALIIIGIGLSLSINMWLCIIAAIGALLFFIGSAFNLVYSKNLKATYGSTDRSFFKAKLAEAHAAASATDSAQALYAAALEEYDEFDAQLTADRQSFADTYGYNLVSADEIRQRLNAQKKQAHIRLLALSEEVGAIEAKLSCTGDSRLDENEAEISALQRRRGELTHFYDSIGLAAKALSEAQKKMQQSFTPTLNSAASKYFSEITGGKYDRLFTDDNLKINVELNIPRSSELFSGGTIDQMYFSLRLALTDMMFGEAAVPIILDQPFAQYDKKRRNNAEKLLCRLAEKRQIILFTENDNLFSDISATEILT